MDYLVAFRDIVQAASTAYAAVIMTADAEQCAWFVPGHPAYEAASRKAWEAYDAAGARALAEMMEGKQ